MSRRHGPDLVTEPGNLVRPEARRRASLHPNQMGRQAGKEWGDLCVAELAPQTGPPVGVDAVSLEDIFRKVETDRYDDIRHGGTSLYWNPDPYIGTLIMRHGGNLRTVGTGAVHPIKIACRNTSYLEES